MCAESFNKKQTKGRTPYEAGSHFKMSAGSFQSAQTACTLRKDYLKIWYTTKLPR
jgi:hypothetical protein